MAYDKILPRVEDNRESDEIYSAGWWGNRTPEELRDIIKRGFAGGAEFKGALAESERRAAEAMRRLRDAAAAEAEERKRLTVYLAMAVLIATVVGIASAAKWLFMT